MARIEPGTFAPQPNSKPLYYSLSTCMKKSCKERERERDDPAATPACTPLRVPPLREHVSNVKLLSYQMPCCNQCKRKSLRNTRDPTQPPFREP